jgi:hypothetical protein
MSKLNIFGSEIWLANNKFDTCCSLQACGSYASQQGFPLPSGLVSKFFGSKKMDCPHQ